MGAVCLGCQAGEAKGMMGRKLPEDFTDWVYEQHLAGRSNASIAREIGRSGTRVHQICNQVRSRRQWRLYALARTLGVPNPREALGYD
jgi:hypothetical protein